MRNDIRTKVNEGVELGIARLSESLARIHLELPKIAERQGVS